MAIKPMETTPPTDGAATGSVPPIVDPNLSSNAPPPEGSAGSTDTLAKDVKLPARRVVTTTQGLASMNIAKGEFSNQTMSESSPNMRSQTVEFDYTGQQLVNNRGVPERGQYDVTKEAASILTGLSPDVRRGLVAVMQSHGMYGGSKPSNTLVQSVDIGATQEFLLFANSQGVTVDVAMGLLKNNYPAVAGTGRRFRPPARQDVVSVFEEAIGRILGRAATPGVTERFVKAFTEMNRKEFAGGETAPNVQVAAEAQIKQEFGPEAQAVGALSLMNVLDKAIKGIQ
jgi:hypothetical protein